MAGTRTRSKTSVSEVIERVERRRARAQNPELAAADDALLRMMRLSLAGGGKKVQLTLFPRRQRRRW